MTDERVHAIFLQVCDLPPEERARRLDELCVDDSTLRGRVESLLKHDAADDDLLGDSAMESGEPPVARLLAGTPGEARDAPERIAGFRILAKIGEGGMGTVYAAEQEHPRRRVALKMIRPGVMTEVLRKRFRAEAEMLGRLQHPGIAQIHEAGEVDTGNGRRPYFAMEYVEGRDLRRHARDNDLGVPERLELVSRVADAVHHAHSRGVIHRDLKPENVLVSEEPAPTLAGVPARFAGLGQPKVLDFGVARACDSDQQLTTMHTMAGEILGTLTYMSPEQIAGRHEEVDERSDVYALGVILYELLAGRPPCDFRSLTIVQAARVAAESDPLRLGSVDSAWRGDIETIVGKALEKEPGRRYESAAELATDLRRHLTNEPIAARRPSASYQVRKFARRHRGLVAGLAAAFAILVAGVVTTSVLAVRASRNARVAEEQRRQARAEAYRFSLAAVEALGTNDPARALHHLEGAPEEYRGWEWAFLRARLLSHDILLRGDAACEWAHGFARDPGGRLKALLRRGGALEIVDVLSGAVERRVAVDAEPTVPVLSPDGSRLAVWFESLTRLDVWDLESGRRLFEHPVTISPNSAPSFDASGRRLVVPTEGEITTLDAGTGEVLLRHEESRMPQHVALHPGGEGLACSVASRGGADTLWYLRLSSSGRTMAARRYVASCYAMAFAPDGKWIAAASRLRVLLLSPETMEIDRALHGFPGRVTAVAFSPDGRSLAAAGYRVARLFDLSGSVAPRSFPVKGRPTSVEFSGDGSRLAVGSTAEVRSYDLGPNDPRVLRGHATWVYNVAFSPDGTRLASSDFDGGAIVWNPVTGERAATCMEAGARSVLQFSADGTQLLLGSRRGTKPCRTWNPVTGRKGTAEPGDPSRTGLHDHYEETLGYQECRQVHGRDERVRLEHEGKWPVRVVVNGQVSLRLGAGRPGRPQAIALSPDETRAVTGHTDGTVALWDLSTGRELARGGGHTGTVFALEFHPDGSRVVSGGNDGLMIVRNPSDLLPLVSLRGHESYVHDLDFRPDGKMLASASGDGTVRVWDATPHLERRPTSNR